MKFLAGWIAGMATAWAALAIYQRVPPLGEIVCEPDAEPRRGDRRPGYDDSVAGWPPPYQHDPAAFYRVDQQP
ncbi:hypothetical protein PBI_TEAMOCIL_19 [Microbacterium phage Teamocil]|uniref:Uncharacterized protein n=1 Tax=Microbacterium phage Teamocil TaxID=2656554 RepID=A0A649VXN7_9CAUD|nr:hypothetical protein QDA12_gp19 [Microbacterium phage Teamocil]QGJ88874.1 hypothetical protein PBI_GINA_19 [Microbacterium phage Gina]QGJ96971.1 hypothetical protein PBI_TEAMOCIL_19 [Microbacterium phage Teamocil]